MKPRIFHLLLLLVTLLLSHCGATDPDLSVAVDISPYQVVLSPGETRAFRGRATVTRHSTSTITINQKASDFFWSVQEAPDGGSLAPDRSTDTRYLYTAPQVPGTYHVVIASKEDPTETATAVVIVR